MPQHHPAVPASQCRASLTVRWQIRLRVLQTLGPRMTQWMWACAVGLTAMSGVWPCAAAAADPTKVLHMAFEVADDGFDLVRTYNHYSGFVVENIFEPLLTYDYLARPAKLVPNTALTMPEVQENGRVYVFHIRPGIYFAPDPAFKGKRRELKSGDYAYAFKRYLDPQNRSPNSSFLDGKIAGMDALVAQAKARGKFDYDAPLKGLQTPDDHTLRIELTRPDYNFLFTLAYGGMGAVAREVIDTYGTQSGLHPVGTGPYMLKEYVPHGKIVLEANPEFRGLTWDFKAAEPGDDALIKAMRGKHLPQIGRVEISIIEEEQSRWLAFQNRQIDLDYVPQGAAPKAIDGDHLRPELLAQHIQLQRFVEPSVSFTIINMSNPVVGGYGKEKVALRRAMAMAFNNDDLVRLIYNSQAQRAQMLVPPGVGGHDDGYRSSIAYDPALANKLLDHFGYKRGADGYRTLPDGSPLVVKIQHQPAQLYINIAEFWKRSLDAIGIRSEHPSGTFADNQKAATRCELMMWFNSWNADFPDAENFFQLLYGPNARKGNHSCYQSDTFDRLYQQALALPPGTERDRIYATMNRQEEADTPWVVHLHRIRNWVTRPWVLGFKKHPILHGSWVYLDIDPSKQ